MLQLAKLYVLSRYLISQAAHNFTVSSFKNMLMFQIGQIRLLENSALSGPDLILALWFKSQMSQIHLSFFQKTIDF